MVAFGNQIVHGVDLQQVAGLLGLEYDAEPKLTPDELTNRQLVLLRLLHVTIERIPPDCFQMTIPGSDRTIWGLIEHMVEIHRVYQSVANDISTFDTTAADAEVVESSTMSELHQRLEMAMVVLEHEDYDYNKTVETYFGSASLHYVLERTTWHIAQHLRQLEDLMRKVNTEIMPEIDHLLLDGLPVPKEVWD